ncbi:MAG: ABC transporter ATP-binding protein [Myxococcota bacterium]|nr:ABC transporter ATP-binding protein [Myxococcota bacterium]
MSQATQDPRYTHEGMIPPREALWRLLALARPYLFVILAITLLSAAFAAGRYGRAYMMKPLLDGVLVPAAEENRASGQTPDALWPWEDKGGNEPSALARTDSGSPPANATARDRAEIESALRQLLWIGALIVLITPLALFGRNYLSDFAMGRIHLDLQRKLAAKLLRMPLALHDEARRGDLITRLQHDANAARQVNQIFLQDFMVSLCMVTAGLFSLFYISWPLALLSLCVAPLIASVMLFFGRRIRTRSLDRQAQLGEVTGRLMGILSGIKVIKAFGGEETESKAFGREANRLFRHDMRVARHRALSRSAAEALNSAAGIGVLAAAIAFVLSGRFGLSLGDVAWFSTALATTYKPIKDVSRGWGRLMENLASGQRLFTLLDSQGEEADPADAVQQNGVERGIRFQDISFSYRDNRGRAHPVLDGFNLEVQAGAVVAIVGRTGAGKTSLMDLLLRFREPDQGSIEIDGQDIRKIRRRDLLDQVAIVTQDAFLFDTTIMENIRYGREEASDEEVLEAARTAHVDEFVDHLPEGWATQVGELGVLLSGGQRQRITIARALLRRPSILIFDEATSALDAKTEKTIQDAIQALRGRRTIFLIAHRLSTVRQADRIIVLDQGRITHSGTHEELMRDAGPYREWIRLQNNPE